MVSRVQHKQLAMVLCRLERPSRRKTPKAPAVAGSQVQGACREPTWLLIGQAYSFWRWEDSALTSCALQKRNPRISHREAGAAGAACTGRRNWRKDVEIRGHHHRLVKGQQNLKEFKASRGCLTWGHFLLPLYNFLFPFQCAREKIPISSSCHPCPS